MRLVYVVGYPGSGKTTAMAGAIAVLGWQSEGLNYDPIPHIRYDSGAIQLGRERGPMSGTDALSMSISPIACRWMHQSPAPLVLAEGDRLAHARFLDAAGAVGPVQLVVLDLPPSMARARSVDRGSKQNLTWFKGRISKVDNLIARRAHIALDATAEPPAVAEALAEVIRGAAG